jgi:hypothetical protein
MKARLFLALILAGVLLVLAMGFVLAQGPSPGTNLAAESADAATAPWFITRVDSTTLELGVDDVGQHASVVIDPARGTTYVSYYDVTNKDLRLAKYVGSGGDCGPSNTWSCETVDSAGDVGQFSSIDVYTGTNWLTDPWTLGIAYHDITHRALKYAKYYYSPIPSPGYKWSISTIVTDIVSSYGQYASLKFDSTGTPHIAHYRWVIMGDDALAYAYEVGSGGNCGPYNNWQCDNIDTGNAVGENTSLDLNSSDQPAIAYYDDSNDDLKFAAYGVWHKNANCGPGGNTWTCWTVDSIGDVGKYASMYLDPSHYDRPRIAYHDATNEDLKYAVYQGSGNCGFNSSTFKNEWQCEEMDAMGPSGTHMGISIAEAGADYPIIAYQDASSALGPAVLKVARPATALGLLVGNCGPQDLFYLWQCDIIDNAADGGGWTNEGDYVSIAVNPAGLATIAYYESDSYYTTGRLKVAYQQLQVFLPLVLKNH